jgi:hypothetical protein
MSVGFSVHCRARRIRERAVAPGNMLGGLPTDTYAEPAMTATNSNR